MAGGGEEKSVSETAAAPPGEQNPSATSGGKHAVLRVWTDRTGLHQVQARYVELEAGKVTLEKADGTLIHVPLSSLSEADQRFIGVVQ